MQVQPTLFLYFSLSSSLTRHRMPFFVFDDFIPRQMLLSREKTCLPCSKDFPLLSFFQSPNNPSKAEKRKSASCNSLTSTTAAADQKAAAAVSFLPGSHRNFLSFSPEPSCCQSHARTHARTHAHSRFAVEFTLLRVCRTYFLYSNMRREIEGCKRIEKRI